MKEFKWWIYHTIYFREKNYNHKNKHIYIHKPWKGWAHCDTWQVFKESEQEEREGSSHEKELMHPAQPPKACVLLLLLLSCFSCVQLCATPEMAAHQAPPSQGFSRQEHWRGLPFPSPMHESESEVAQSCPTLSDPMDCSLPGSSVHGSFQARVLEWVAIAFSKNSPLT